MDTKIEKNFIVPPLVIWILVLANYAMAISIAFSLTALSESVFMLGFTLCLLIVTWMIFLSDVSVNKFRNRTYWIIVLLFTPLLAYPFYLAQRSRKIIRP